MSKLARFFLALGTLLWGSSIGIAQKATEVQNGAQKHLSEITASLINNSVMSIDILHMPDAIETRAAVTPANLERWHYFRITVNNVREWSGRAELVEALRSTKITSNSHMPDLRSAIIFKGSDDQRIGALYFGRFNGKYLGQFGSANGSVEDPPVTFKGNLASWLKRMIPDSMK